MQASANQHGIVMAGKRRVPKAVGPEDIERLTARRPVMLPKQRKGQPAKAVSVNTDAAWMRGMAGLAYVSSSLGNRAVLVACRGPVESEYLALLMAMGDAEKSEISGPVDFRLDSTTVGHLTLGETSELVALRHHLEAMLARHRKWRLILVEREQNRIADGLARRTLKQWQES